MKFSCFQRLTMSAVLAIFLTACGGGNNNTPPAATITETPPVFLDASVASGSLTNDHPKMQGFSAPFTSFSAYIDESSSSSAHYKFDARRLDTEKRDQYISVSVYNRTQIHIVYFDGPHDFTSGVGGRFECQNCTGVTIGQTADGVGVVITLNNVKLPYNSSVTVPNPYTITLNGTLTGKSPNGYILASQLPHNTQGDVIINGAAQPILRTSFDYPYPSQEQPDIFPFIRLKVAKGELQFQRVPGSDGGLASNFLSYIELNAAGTGYEQIGPAILPDDRIEITDTAYTLKLANFVLAPDSSTKTVAFNGPLTSKRVGGSLSVAGEPMDFKPVQSSISGNSGGYLAFDFRSTHSTELAKSFGVYIVTNNGAVTSFTAKLSSGKSYSCDDNSINVVDYKCSGSVTLSADKLTLTFTDFKAAVTGTDGKPGAITTFNGVLRANGV